MKKLITFMIAILLITAAILISGCEVPTELPGEEAIFGTEDELVHVEEAATEPADALAEEVAAAEALDAALKQAFVNKYEDWDSDNIVLELSVSTEDFASGGVGFADSFGGGYFYAANTAEGWVIAWDGQGFISCADIEPYDFPAEIIPYCYDYENEVDVER